MDQVKLYAPFTNGTVTGVDGLTYIVDDGYVMVYECDVATLEAAGYVRAVPNEVFNTSLALPKGKGIGVKVDTEHPTFGWRDIIGAVNPKATGVGSPTRAAYDGANIADYAFVANDVCDFCFHIPHDYVPGSDLYFHVHWSHNGTSISGNAVFTIYHTYASRTAAGTTIFPAEKTNTITYATTNIATTPQYAHRVDEIPLTSAAGSSTLTANSVIEVDGILLVNLKLTGLPTIGGAGKLFIHTCDVHYQSTNMATKNSGPNYYA